MSKNQAQTLPKIFWAGVACLGIGFVLLLIFVTRMSGTDEPVARVRPPSGVQRTGPRVTMPKVGEQAPDFTLTRIDNGKKLTLSSLKGRTVLVNFWATWCAPCRIEIPNFIEAKKKYGDKLEIVAISLDRNPLQVLPNFISRSDINFTVLYAPDIADIQDLLPKYGGVNAIPTSFLVDPEGRIAKHYRGLYPEDRLREDLQKVIQS